MSKDLIVKKNEFVEARYKLTASEAKIVTLLASVINKSDEDFKNHRFKVSELLKLTGLGEGNYDDLRELTYNLMQKVLQIREENSLLQIAFLSKARYNYNDGTVDLRFDPDLKPYLLKLKESFVQYRLENILQLKSFYSIRFYELLVKWKKIGKFKVSIDKLKEIFKLEQKSYSRYNDFKRYVVIPAQKELEEKTDLSFDFEEIKSGRKITHINFLIRETGKKAKQISTKDLELQITENEISPEEERTLSKLLEIGIPLSKANKILEEFDVTRINKQIEYLPFRKASKNKAGLLIKAIQENWSEPKGIKEKKQKEEKQQEKEEHQNQIESMKEIARKAKYLITPTGNRREIINIDEEGNIRVQDEEGKKTMVLSNTAVKCAFTA